MLKAWSDKAKLYEEGKITKEEYDKWRYNYPESENNHHWAKLPSYDFNDMVIEVMNTKDKKTKIKKK